MAGRSRSKENHNQAQRKDFQHQLINTQRQKKNKTLELKVQQLKESFHFSSKKQIK